MKKKLKRRPKNNIVWLRNLITKEFKSQSLMDLRVLKKKKDGIIFVTCHNTMPLREGNALRQFIMDETGLPTVIFLDAPVEDLLMLSDKELENLGLMRISALSAVHTEIV